MSKPKRLTTQRVQGVLRTEGFEMGKATGRKRDQRHGVTVFKLTAWVVAVSALDAQTALEAARTLQGEGLQLWSPVTKAVVEGPVTLEDVKGGCFRVAA